jgi:hypothetical protein
VTLDSRDIARGDHTGAFGAHARMSRRSLLRSSLGAAVLVAAPELLLPRSSRAAAAAAGQPAPASNYFVYGMLDPTTDVGPSIQSVRPQASGTAAPVASDLAALPVRSPDGTRLALVTLGEGSNAATVTVSVVDAATASAVSSGTLALPGVPDALILATPTFAADSATVALVLSITVPTNPRTLSKMDPTTGQLRVVQSATWVSRHVLAYFDARSSSFAGPFDLADAPSLAHVNVAANGKDLFLWTLAEPAAVMGTKDRPLPAPMPRLTVFPLGSGKPRLTVDASDVWPVNDEPMAVLGNSAVARLVYGRTVEVYAADSGRFTSTTIAPLAQDLARPARTSMQLRPDGLVFLSNAGLGVAALADPAQGFAVQSTVSYAPPAAPAGGPQSKAVLSADASTVYAVGSAAGIGLSAYDMRTGRLEAVASDRDYIAVYGLPSGTLLAVTSDSPSLTFFDPSLRKLGAADTSLTIVEVY